MISKNVSGKHKEKGDSYGSVEFYEKQNKELRHSKVKKASEPSGLHI